MMSMMQSMAKTLKQEMVIKLPKRMAGLTLKKMTTATVMKIHLIMLMIMTKYLMRKMTRSLNWARTLKKQMKKRYCQMMIKIWMKIMTRSRNTMTCLRRKMMTPVGRLRKTTHLSFIRCAMAKLMRKVHVKLKMRSLNWMTQFSFLLIKLHH